MNVLFTVSNAVAASETQDEVNGGLLLDVIVSKGAGIVELLAGKDESLLVAGDALPVLDLLLDAFDSVVGLNVESNSLSSEGADEDLLGTTSQAEHQVDGCFLSDVVVGHGAVAIELLSSENKALRISRNALALSDLGLDCVDAVSGLDIDGDGLAGESTNEDLHDLVVVGYKLICLIDY